MQVEDKELQNGSGTQVSDINKFINSYEMTRKLMKKMQNNKGGMKNMMKNMDINSLKGMKFQYNRIKNSIILKAIIAIAFEISSFYSETQIGEKKSGQATFLTDINFLNFNIKNIKGGKKHGKNKTTKGW